MVLSELIQRSPIRVFEQSIHGGLKAGEIGIIASRAGIGKTSVLVQLALDKLLQGKKVIHVSFARNQYVFAWYEDIFREFISKTNLENVDDVKNGLVKNRVLMNFNQDVMSQDQIIRSLRAMITEGGFAAGSVIIDGFDFSRAGREKRLYASLENVKAFAVELGLSVWYSCTVNGEGLECDGRGMPSVLKEFTDIIDVIVTLEPGPDHIELSITKDRDSVGAKTMAMRLDTKTLLISG